MSLSKKIKNKMDLVKEFVIPERDVNTTIKALEVIQENHPAYIRKQKDKKNWAKLFLYSEIGALVGIGIYFIAFIMLGSLLSASLFLGLVIPPLFLLVAISISILIVPLVINSVVYGAYLGLRNLFNAEIRSENKQYNKLEKIIHELEKLSEKKDDLDSLIKHKLEESELNNFALTQGGDTDTKVIRFQNESSEEIVNKNNNNRYQALFKPLEYNTDSSSYYMSNITSYYHS
jgi:Zn-dependent protease with chaperone function